MDILAAFATELPVILAPIAQVITVETAKPPGKWPTNFVTASKSISVTLAVLSISLIKINIGIAVKRKELFDEKMVWGKLIKALWPSKISEKDSPTNPRPIPTGIPVKIIKMILIKSAAIIMSYLFKINLSILTKNSKESAKKPIGTVICGIHKGTLSSLTETTPKIYDKLISLHP